MAGPKVSWAQVVSSRTKLSTPFKETYQRRRPGPLARLLQLENLVADLMQSSQQLQKENKALQERVFTLESASLGKEKKQDIVKNVIQECISNPDQRLISFIQATAEKEGTRGTSTEEYGRKEEDLQKKIQSSIAEERERIDRALNIRLGGVDKENVERWYAHDKCDVGPNIAYFFKEEFGINIGGISATQRYGMQVILTFRSKQAKIGVLGQARKLKGSRVWMADDLTKIQLSKKKEELLKVKQARLDGMWARYQSGEAVIRKFKEARGGK